jgi:hypothetical protein
MTSDTAGTLDEAYERLHATGPEFDGYLSNHGPMAAEALVRHGHSDLVRPWLDVYMTRLEEFPRAMSPIGADWQAALGDPRRVADWTDYFRREIGEQPWREVLNAWWPRLLPGVAAAATHGVIRVGHAVRALLQDGEDQVRAAELAHGLAYWAARWQTVPAGHAGATATMAAGKAAATPGESLAAVPHIADQSGGIGERLSRLSDLAAWPPPLPAFAVTAAPEQIRARMADLVDAATIRYLFYGHGNGVMLVHSATAPNAVLHALPALDAKLWAPSLAAAWTATAALTAVYAPAEPAPRAQLPQPPAGRYAATAAAAGTATAAGTAANAANAGTAAADTPAAAGTAAATAIEVFARAAEQGDAHVIKFTDTAVEVFARTGHPDAIAAALRAAELIEA